MTSDDPDLTILDEAFIVTELGIRAAKPCAVCGRPINEKSWARICGPCFDYYGTSVRDVVRHCDATGELRARR